MVRARISSLQKPTRRRPRISHCCNCTNCSVRRWRSHICLRCTLSDTHGRLRCSADEPRPRRRKSRHAAHVARRSSRSSGHTHHGDRGRLRAVICRARSKRRHMLAAQPTAQQYALLSVVQQGLKSLLDWRRRRSRDQLQPCEQAHGAVPSMGRPWYSLSYPVVQTFSHVVCPVECE